MPEILRIPLRIVFYKDDGVWIAHCLEFDLIGDGPTEQVAIERLSQAIALQLEASANNGNPANLFCPAEGKYFRMFAAGKDMVARAELSINIERDNVRIGNAEYREYSGAGWSCGLVRQR